MEALFKDTFRSRDEVTGRTEPVKLKPSLAHYCRESSARGGAKTLCSCTGALVQETSPSMTDLQAGMLHRSSCNEIHHKHNKGQDEEQKSQCPMAGLPTGSQGGILLLAQCQWILHMLSCLHQLCLCPKQLSALGSEGPVLR